MLARNMFEKCVLIFLKVFFVEFNKMDLYMDKMRNVPQSSFTKIIPKFAPDHRITYVQSLLQLGQITRDI